MNYLKVKYLVKVSYLLVGCLLTGPVLQVDIFGQTPQEDNYGAILPDTSTSTNVSEVVKWEFGAFTGLLLSTIEGDLTDDHSYIADFSAGVYGTVEIFPPLGLMIEIYYAGLGTGFASIGDSKLHFNYLVLPVMFTYEFRPQYSFVVGPYFGFLLNAKDQGDDFDEDITDLIARLDVGVKLGLYFQATNAFNLGVFFKRGFINTQSGDRVSTFKQYNQCIMFTASVNLSSILRPQ